MPTNPPSLPPSRAVNALTGAGIVACVAVLITVAYFFLQSGISYP